MSQKRIRTSAVEVGAGRRRRNEASLLCGDGVAGSFRPFLKGSGQRKEHGGAGAGLAFHAHVAAVQLDKLLRQDQTGAVIPFRPGVWVEEAPERQLAGSLAAIGDGDGAALVLSVGFDRPPPGGG